MTDKNRTWERAGVVNLPPDDGPSDADRAAERERAHIEEVRNRPEIKALRERAEAEQHSRPLSHAEAWTRPLPPPGQVTPEQQAREDAIAAEAAAEIEQQKEALWLRARRAGCDRRVFDQHIWPTHLAEMVKRKMEQQSEEGKREMAEQIRNWM